MRIFRYSIFLCGVILFCGAIWARSQAQDQAQDQAQGQSQVAAQSPAQVPAQPQVTLAQLTKTDAKTPLRHPFFVYSSPASRGEKPPLSLIWTRGVIDKSEPGREYYEPRSTRWMSWGVASLGAKLEILAAKTRETHVGSYGAGEETRCEVLNSMEKPLLFHQWFQASSVRDQTNLLTRDLRQILDSEKDDSKGFDWQRGLLSVLPYNGNDKEYLGAYREALKYARKEAAAAGHSVHVMPPYPQPSPVVPTEDET